jgi:hypothetical protein
MIKTFTIGPSEEYVRLEADVEEAGDRMRAAQIGSEEHEQATDQFGAEHKALTNTPEFQMKIEMQLAEDEARDMILQMTPALSLTPRNGETIDDALRDKSLSAKAAITPLAKTSALTVTADMRRMTSAQVAKTLRMIATQIDRNGMPSIPPEASWCKPGIPKVWP